MSFEVLVDRRLIGIALFHFCRMTCVIVLLYSCWILSSGPRSVILGLLNC